MPQVALALPAAVVAVAESLGEAAAVGGIAALGTSAAWTSALIAGGATLALGTAYNYLNDPKKAAKSPASNPFGVNANAPRRWCYGRGATQPQIVYWETVGDGNGDLYLVCVVQDTEADAFETFYADNVEVDFSANAATLSQKVLSGCAITTGSATVTGVSTFGLQAGMKYVGSSFFPSGSKIYSIDSPTQFRMDHTATANGPGSLTFNQVSRYVGAGGSPVRMYRYDHFGNEGQAADATLVGASTTGYWTNQCRLQGIAYFVWLLQYRGGDNLYPSGIPTPNMVLRGRKIWDPRQDVSYGGTGTQTRADPSTWTWSQNAALCLLDYLLGIDMAGVRIGGCGVPIARIDIDSFIAAANICDQSVTLASGGTEARYQVNGFVDSIEDKQSVVQSMLTAMDGMLVYRGGQLYLIAGAAQTAVMSLADDDLAGPLKIYPSISRQEKVNTITSLYADPNQNYATVSAPTYSVAGYVTDDKGLTLETEIKHRFTTSLTCVTRLNKLALANHREQFRVDAVYKPRALLISAGDTFTFNSATAGISGQKMLCTQRDLNPDGTVRIMARQETDTKYSWSTGEEQSPPSFNVNAVLDVSAPDAPLLADVAATGATIAGAGASTVPILLLTANPPPNPFVNAILTEWKLHTDSVWSAGPTLTPQSPQAVTTVQGVSSSVNYDVRFAYQTKWANSAWAEIDNVTAGGQLVDTAQLVSSAATVTRNQYYEDITSEQTIADGYTTYASYLSAIFDSNSNQGLPIQLDFSGYIECARSSGSVDGYLVARVFRWTDPSWVGSPAADMPVWGMQDSTTKYIANFASSADGWSAISGTTVTTNAQYLQLTNSGTPSTLGMSKASMSLSFNRVHMRLSYTSLGGSTITVKITFGSTVVYNGTVIPADAGGSFTDFDLDLTSPPGGTGTIKVELTYGPGNPTTYKIDELIFGLKDTVGSLIYEHIIGKTSGTSILAQQFGMTMIDNSPPTSGPSAFVAYGISIAYVQALSDIHNFSSWDGNLALYAVKNVHLVANQIKR